MWLVLGGLLVLFFLQAMVQKSEKREKTMYVAIMMLVFFISAMKKITMTSDLGSYDNFYQNLQEASYGGIISSWLRGSLKDAGFYLVAKVFSDLGASAYLWMGSISLLYAWGFGQFIYRYSDQKLISLMLLFALFFSFTLSGLRQTMALALIFFAYEYAMERKLAPFLRVVFCAFLFHSSALIFLPAYWLVRLRLGIKQILLITAVVLMVIYVPRLYRALISELAWNSSLEEYATSSSGLTWTGFFIQLSMILFCLFFRNRYSEDWEKIEKRVDPFINLMVIGLCLQSFSVIVAESFRMSYYYSMGCLAAVPNIIAAQKKPMNRGLAYFFVGICLLGYTLMNTTLRNLQFFWQN